MGIKGDGFACIYSFGHYELNTSVSLNIAAIFVVYLKKELPHINFFNIFDNEFLCACVCIT